MNGDMRLNNLSAEDTKLAETPQGLRQLLNRYGRDNPLVRHVLDAAYSRGLATCDSMTILAFEALKRLEIFESHALESLMLNTTRTLFSNGEQV